MYITRLESGPGCNLMRKQRQRGHLTISFLSKHRHTENNTNDMMQPTPAPSSAPNSPSREAEPVLETPAYAHPPGNVGSAPFGVLVGLFQKLQNERKPDRRRKLIDAWFTVCPKLFIHCLTA